MNVAIVEATSLQSKRSDQLAPSRTDAKQAYCYRLRYQSRFHSRRRQAYLFALLLAGVNCLALVEYGQVSEGGYSGSLRQAVPSRR